MLPDTSPKEEFTTSLGSDQAVRITCHPPSIIRGTTGTDDSYAIIVIPYYWFHSARSCG